MSSISTVHTPELSDFYDVYVALCEDVSLLPSQAADDMGLNKGTVSLWKADKQKQENCKTLDDKKKKSKPIQPRHETLLKISKYFSVPLCFLKQEGPFAYWKEILDDYPAFLKATGLPIETLRTSWGMSSPPDPNDSSKPAILLKPLVSFINDYVKEIHHENGQWTIISKANTGELPTRDIFKILESLREGLEKNNVFFYRNAPISDKSRNRLIWAIQLGLDAADSVNENGNKPS